MRDLVAAGSGRALGALCGSALVVMVAVGCQASVAPVSLPKKAPLSSPLPVSSPLSGAAAATAPAWTPQQREVRRAYYDAQVALNAASDSQDPVTARTILAPDILPSEIPVFIQEMAAFWQKRKISGGTLAYHVENIWLNGITAAIATCWPPGSFIIKSAATGQRVPPFGKKAKNSVTQLDLVKGRWLEGPSARVSTPCS